MEVASRARAERQDWSSECLLRLPALLGAPHFVLPVGSALEDIWIIVDKSLIQEAEIL